MTNDEEYFRKQRLHRTSWDNACAITHYVNDKYEQGIINRNQFMAIDELEKAVLKRDSDNGDYTGARIQATREVLALLLRFHPELRSEIDARLCGSPRSAPLARAIEEQSQIKKFLNAQFDLERITLSEEEAVLTAGDQALKRAMARHRILDVHGYRGELAVEAANKAMKRKLVQLRPELAKEVNKLGFSWRDNAPFGGFLAGGASVRGPTGKPLVCYLAAR